MVKKGQVMKIETGKTYLTRDGQQARVLCTDLKDEKFPVIAVVLSENKKEEYPFPYTLDGERYKSIMSDYDLISEYSFWNDVEVDTPIYVRDDEDECICPKCKEHCKVESQGTSNVV